ncbi:MAG: short-chain dehydrogenase [Acidobacteriota bacterium]|nr:short-chain dehydrogenase [Acidobacteriota bacterium]MDH3522732.1 short-chain dehydrogenase [Acidobacteriota bacterium]
MKLEGSKVLVLGGYGLVGMAVCRELLGHGVSEIRIHSLQDEESAAARDELAAEAGATRLSTAAGNIFGLARDPGRLGRIGAQLEQLTDESLREFLLYRLLVECQPDVVIDCVNTATAIAYRDVYSSAEALWREVAGGDVERETAAALLEALYVPRLIRHIQVLYRGLLDTPAAVYAKVGTSGTGGMGLNVPYTHSEERPSRVLLSKSAMAGAHSMLLFLMARTPDGPIIKEIKPAAAIAWKRIERGPILRKGAPIRLVDARPQPLGRAFSTHDESFGRETDETLATAFIDTGENGLFSLEEFAMLTTAEQMEFVTPEEIARYLVFEIEGGNTGHDIINALDNAVMGPTYRAGLMRHFALERMAELEGEGKTRSVAFEMLGPPRNTKLLFEAHLLREEFGAMTPVRESTAEEIERRLDRLVRERPRLANEIAAVGIPVLLASGEMIRGPRVIVPGDSSGEELTPERLEAWCEAGWVDLRRANCARWQERFERIHRELSGIRAGDTSSRHLRNARFWNEEKSIRPGKIVGWILSVEERGDRFKR